MARLLSHNVSRKCTLKLFRLVQCTLKSINHKKVNLVYKFLCKLFKMIFQKNIRQSFSVHVSNL